MTRTGTLLGAALTIVGLAVTAFAGESAEDLARLRTWGQALEAPERGDLDEAGRGLAEHFDDRGAEALSWLRDAMARGDPAVRPTLLLVIDAAFPGGSTSIAEHLTAPREQDRECAAWALATLGERAATTIGALTESLEDEQPVRIAAATAVGRIGRATPGALASLRRGATSSDTAVAKAMIRGLAGVGDTNTLEPMLRHAETRTLARAALNEAGPQVFEALASLAESDSWIVRSVYAGLLGRDGADAERVHPMAVRLAADEAAAVRAAALKAMWCGGPATPASLAAVRAGLADEDVWIRRAALGAVHALVGEDETRSTLLAGVLVSDDGDRHPLAALALLEMTTLSSVAYDALGQAVGSPVTAVSAPAAAARIAHGDRDPRLAAPFAGWVETQYGRYGGALWNESRLLHDRVVSSRGRGHCQPDALLASVGSGCAPSAGGKKYIRLTVSLPLG